MSTLNQWLTHLAIMRRARKMGTLFPQWKKPDIKSAPKGTTEAPTFGSPWKRLVKEVAWFRISEHHFELPKLQKPIRIIHISDVHLREHNDWLEQLNKAFLGLEGDVVALTGDIITRGWTEEALDSFLNAIPRGKSESRPRLPASFAHKGAVHGEVSTLPNSIGRSSLRQLCSA